MERAITLPKVTKDIGELLSEASSSNGTAWFGREHNHMYFPAYLQKLDKVEYILSYMLM